MPPSPNSLGKITNHIDPTSPNSLYERLVVFIYKKSLTNEYKIYIPNEKKQHAFPDLDYETSDILRSDEYDVVKTLFKKVLYDVRSWLNVWINTHNPSVKPRTTTAKPSQVEPHKPTDYIWHGSGLINHIIQHAKSSRILEFLYRFRESKQILGFLTGKTLQEKLLQLKQLYPNIYRNFMTKVTKFYPIWLIKGNIIRYKPGQLRQFPYDIKLIPLINGKKVIINGQLQPHRNVQEIIIYTPKQTIINELYPEIYISSNLSFDQWLNFIVKGLNVQLNFASKVIDKASLKAFVLDVIKKHKLSIDLEGYLVDAYGRRIKLSNLILRPILIGEANLISRVINDGLFKIPSGIVFVEALLISEGTLKTLGVIPISHIFVGHREEIISETTTVQVVETITTCENGKCNSKKVCKNVQGEEEPCKDFTQLGSRSAPQDEDEKSETSDSLSSRSGCKDKHKCKKCKNKHCHDLQSEPLVVVEIPVADGSIPEPYIILDKSGNAISPTANKSPDSDEELDIRIIGGNAATNSGTPVSVKGRSGY